MKECALAKIGPGEGIGIREKNIVNIVYMNEPQRVRLSQRIAGYNGLIRIFIHPFYEKYQDTKCWRNHTRNGDYPRIDTVKSGMRNILSLPPEKTPPVFVFEDLRYLSKTIETVEDMNKYSANEIYLVPTIPNYSAPNFTNNIRNRENQWPKIIDIFKKLGVKIILIGGMRFTFQYSKNPNFSVLRFLQQLKESGAMDTHLNVSRCIGSTIEKLARDFKIEISSLTHPHSREDLRIFSFEGKTEGYMVSNEDLMTILDMGLEYTGIPKNPFTK